MANHHGFIVTVIAASVVALCCYQGLHRVPRAPIDAVFGERRRMTSWLSDPKTVILKSDAKIVAHDIQKLRYAAFGTSKTWGSGLDDPDRETYIKMLSPTARNFGLRATPADYPSFCLHSMIGDEVFDLIILEFSPYESQHEDFARLTRRLRDRFPAAIIIFLPVYMLLYDVVYQQKDLNQFIRQTGLSSPRSPEFVDIIRNLNDLELSYPISSYAVDVYRNTVDSVGGYVIEFPEFQGDIKDFILWNAKYYGRDADPWDMVHPSVLGHQIIAEKIKVKVFDIMSHRPPPDFNVLGVWSGGKDKCTSWYSSANITEEIQNVANMNLVNFNSELGWDSRSKWALEVDQNGGSLSVLCQFPHCNIYLSYMAKGPERVYPRVLVSVGDNEPKLLDPHLSSYHLRQMAYVGTMINAGLSTIAVKPIPDDLSAPLRFRITGVITTPTTY